MASFNYHGDGVLSKVRADGRRVFFVRYSFRGRRTTEKLGLEPTWDEESAKAHLLSRRRSMDEDPSWVPPHLKRREKVKADRKKRIRFRKFAETFSRDWSATRRSATKFFAHMERQLVDEFGETYLDEITLTKVQAFVARRAKTRAPKTANHTIRFFKCMLNRAVEWGELSENPLAKMKTLKEPAGREIVLEADESTKLLEVAQPHLRPIVQFALLTGFRRGEILSLRWPQVDFRRRQITLRFTKSGKARTVPIGDDLKALLEGLPRHVKHDHVFSYQGKPLKSLQGSWEEARAALVGKLTEEPRKAVLVDLHFHDLRHTWASRFMESGGDLYTLMALGGWETVAMVKRYVKFGAGYLADAANRLNGTAGEIPKKTEDDKSVHSQVASLVASPSQAIESMRQQSNVLTA